MQQKIFVLGDSRTGTLSLSRYLSALGFRSIHYFVREAKQKQPDHLHHAQNWNTARDFYLSSQFNAFSDYPTRSHWNELHDQFPGAYFILLSRATVEAWQTSMVNFFEKFNIDVNLENLTRAYINTNSKIRQLYGSGDRNFLDICIDDDAISNSKKIKDFLGVTSSLELGHENRTDAYDNSIWSKRVTFFQPSNPDSNLIDYIQAICAPGKAMPSERGWLFLVNDANEFLHYQYGYLAWTPEDLTKASLTIAKRTKALKLEGISYLKFIIPEKSVAYQEYLPHAFDGRETVARPAQQLAAEVGSPLHYLGDYIVDLKSQGQLYFKGDTHTTWLGAYFVYRYIIDTLSRIKHIEKRQAFNLAQLDCSLAYYEGDLAKQLSAQLSHDFLLVTRATRYIGGLDALPRYTVPNCEKKSKRVDPRQEYLQVFDTRETIIYEQTGTSLPKAVLFRDSVADFVIDLLAEHFARLVVIWHKGLVYKQVIEFEQPDIVLHMMAERFVWQYKHHAPFVRVEALEALGGKENSMREVPLSKSRSTKVVIKEKS